METNLQNSNETFSYLKSINDLIKNPLGRELGFEKLKAVQTDALNPGLQMYCCYLKGKYYSFIYRGSKPKDIIVLETANDYFDEILEIARINNIQIKNPKYLFLCAHSKYELSRGHSKESLKKYFFGRAKTLTEKALKTFGTNESLLWLSSEINKKMT